MHWATGFRAVRGLAYACCARFSPMVVVACAHLRYAIHGGGGLQPSHCQLWQAKNTNGMSLLHCTHPRSFWVVIARFSASTAPCPTSGVLDPTSYDVPNPATAMGTKIGSHPYIPPHTVPTGPGVLSARPQEQEAASETAQGCIWMVQPL